MRKLLLTTALGLSMAVNAQAINDSVQIVIGSSDFLVYEKYNDFICYPEGDYIKGLVENTHLYPVEITKCARRSSQKEEYKVKAYYNGLPIYFNLEENKPLLLLGEKAYPKDLFNFYETLSGEDRNKLDTLHKQKSLDYNVFLRRQLTDKIFEFEKYGIAIIEAHPTDDYSMTGARFEILNTSKKEIKYITFNFYGINNVGDKVGINKSFKGIGPVESFEKGEWESDAVWLTDIVQKLKLLSVNIIYMNGSSRNIPITSKHWMDSDIIYQLENL